jgi:hypothetical protein
VLELPVVELSDAVDTVVLLLDVVVIEVVELSEVELPVVELKVVLELSVVLD